MFLIKLFISNHKLNKLNNKLFYLSFSDSGLLDFFILFICKKLIILLFFNGYVYTQYSIGEFSLNSFILSFIKKIKIQSFINQTININLFFFIIFFILLFIYLFIIFSLLI